MSSHRSARCLVIYNPTAGRRRRRRLAASLAVLDRAGVACELVETRGPDDAERLAADSGPDFGMVAVAGGDGTVNGAINGLMARAGAGRRVAPLGILPLGTANVLAAELGIPTDPESAAEILAAGASARIFIGRANGRYFSTMAGVGFDALVVERVRPRLKRLLGKGAYVVETVRQLARGAGGGYRATVAGETVEAASVVVANSRYYGGRFVLAPDARLDREELQVCLFLSAGRLAAIRYLLAMPLGRLPRLADYRIVPARHVSIAGRAGDPVQGDGDILTRVPVDIDLAPERLTVVVPAGSPLQY